MRDEFIQMDRELSARLRLTGTAENRERLIIENLRRKETIVASEKSNVVPFNRNVRG